MNEPYIIIKRQRLKMQKPNKHFLLKMHIKVIQKEKKFLNLIDILYKY